MRLVFDIGGTNLRMALADDASVADIRKVATPQGPEEAVEAFVAYARERPGIEHAAGGIAGIIEDGRIVRSPHLPGWDGFDFAGALEVALGVPVTAGNDADVAALGEALHGAGRGHASVAYIAIGTGVGGSLVLDGGVMPHAEGLEPGHHIIDFEGGRTLEDLVGGASLLAETGSLPQELPREFMQERVKPLAAGLYNVIRLWSPDILVLNGALMNDETGFAFDWVTDALRELVAHRYLPVIARGTLGDDSALYGAASL